jgi:hypothetical protein
VNDPQPVDAAAAGSPQLVRVLILCSAGMGTEAVRKIGSGLLSLSPEDLMKTPLSPTGLEPATHWICKNYFPAEVVRQMQSHPIRHGTEILYGSEGGTTAQVLASRGLKRIHPAPRREP